LVTDSTNNNNEVDIGQLLTQSMRDEIDVVPVEERLIKKGVQYKNALVQKRHVMIT
jgi:hypothetical protein